MTDSEKVDLVIIGAGIVGTSLAARLSRRFQSVFVLDQNERIADGVTSRNSGVIHSGLYYQPGSLKSKTCIRGNELLYEYCSKKDIPHNACGKLVLATRKSEESLLDELLENSKSAGARDVRPLTKGEISSLEKDVLAGPGLLCRRSGIVDPVALTESLRVDAEENGVFFSLQTKVEGISGHHHGFKIETSHGKISTERVVNSAGLYADEIAEMADIHKYRVHPWRGDYFRWITQKQFRHLIYPVPNPNRVGLGVHLTIDLSGHYRLGPDSTYSKNKEPGGEADGKREKFYKAAERLFGPFSPDALAYDQHGIRPTLRTKDDKDFKDFVVSEDLPGFYNFVGIESPGITSALALAEYFEEQFIR